MRSRERWVAIIIGACMSLQATGQRSATQSEDPPIFNGPPYSALMNSIPVTIPKEYRATANFQILPGDSEHAKELDINLREGSLQPILTRRDQMDWQGNWLKPYAINSPEHRWLATVIRPLISEGPRSNMPSAVFQRLTRGSKLVNFGCQGLKFGLTYCVGSAPPDNEYMHNEFFYDGINQRTLISCINIPRINYLACTHYIPISAIDSVAEVTYSSPDELSDWKNNEEGFKKILETFRGAD